MTDRELLELAAKAAGIDGYFASDFQDERDEYWNALTDDGDALRLAVFIGLSGGVCLSMFFADGLDPTVVVRKNGDSPGSMELVGDDPYAATRRAIVRAAAELGKAMQ